MPNRRAHGLPVPLSHVAVTQSVDRALEILGDRWTTLTVLGAFVGCRRFDHWRERLGISRSVLANRLRRLLTVGILLREPIEPGARRHGYRLTPMGLDLHGWALAIRHWEMSWTSVADDYPLFLRHRVCGSAFEPEFVCAACDERVDAPDQIQVANSGGGVRRAVSPVAGARQRRSTITRDTAQGSFGYLFGECVEIVADRWSFLVIAAAFAGVTRFQALEGELGIASNILSDRLRRLEELGVLERQRYQAHPARYEYCLTASGRDLYPMLLMLSNWGDRWLWGRGGPWHSVIHRGCGHPLELVTRCSACAGRLRPQDVRLEHAGIPIYGG